MKSSPADAGPPSVRLLKLQKDLAISLGVCRTLTDAAYQILSHALQIDGFDGGGLYIHETATDMLTLIAHHGLPMEFVETAKRYPTDSPQGQLVLSGQPVFCTSKELPVAIPQHAFRSMAIVPIHHCNRVVAVLNLVSYKQDHVEAGTRHAVEATAAQMGEVVARIEACDALHANEQRLRTILEASPVAIVVTNLHGKHLLANGQAAHLFGYHSSEELKPSGKTFFDIIADKDRQRLKQDLRNCAHSGRMFHAEYLSQTKNDGSPIQFELSASLLSDHPGDLAELIVVLRKVSHHKKAEMTLRTYQEKLQRLSAQLITTEDQQRRRLAEALHDHIAQHLSLAAMKLDALNLRTAEPSTVETAKQAHDCIQKALDQTRRMTFDLSSPVLHKYGLEAAVADLIEREMHLHTNLQINLTSTEPALELDEHIKMFFFKAVRELLINVVKHAQATQVTISIRSENKAGIVMVSDNGCGFQREAIGPFFEHIGGFGLFNIHERVHDLGGSMSISSQPGEGTQVTLTVPLRECKNE